MLSERERVKSKKQEANTRREKKRTPPEIGFASKENLFSYDKAPVNKSAFFVVSNQRERKSEKIDDADVQKKKKRRREIALSLSLRARTRTNQKKSSLRVPLAPFAMSG